MHNTRDGGFVPDWFSSATTAFWLGGASLLVCCGKNGAAPERLYAVTGVREPEGTVVRITGRAAFRFAEAFMGPRSEER